MNEAQHIIPRLKRLIELENSLSHLKKNEDSHEFLLTEIGSIRALLPTAILRHHDSRILRGQKSLAPVIAGVCGACHLAIPSGRLADLRRIHNDLNVCDHCNAFIYLEEETTAPSVFPKRASCKKDPISKRIPKSVGTRKASVPS